GALDYILKPFKLNSVLPVLSRAHAVRKLRVENRSLMEQVTRRTEQLEAANQELVRANQELEVFIHSVSHDLRQPLNGVIGFSDLLRGEKPGALNAVQKEYVGEILESGQRLLRLTEDLLQFSRLGQQRLRKETVNIGQLVSDVVRGLRSAEPQRAVEVRVGTLPEASADPSLLKQVFINLLSNAFKFTRHSARALIEISGERSTDSRTYRIRDNGAGFDMAQAHRLFTIFQRLHAQGEFEGTGVGLSIVQRIIERHGGSIRAEGAPGQGATFTFTLPA
ncbi:MAG TPA: ATP-binding protein, partial [Steroidobacteraceae bacterium]|nr:ATP-binding protein [Steroidobacteraceae bacterium]